MRDRKKFRLWLRWVFFLAVHGLLIWVLLSLPADMLIPIKDDPTAAKTVLATAILFSSAVLWLQSLELARLSRDDVDSKKLSRVWAVQNGPWLAAGFTLNILFMLLLNHGGVIYSEESLGSKGIFFADWIICEIAYKMLAAYRPPNADNFPAAET